MSARYVGNNLQLAQSDLDGSRRELINEFQRGLPLTARPFEAMGKAVGLSEDEVLETLRMLHEQGAVSRVGAVVRPNTVGASTLAAMAVPPARLEEVAHIVNGFTEVNHNYEREHRFNLWFVVTAADATQVSGVLARLETATGLAVMALPLVADYHIDLGFELKWS